MNFRKYSDIENAYRERFIDAIHRAGYGGDEYIVQEKIHGANFSIYVNRDGVKFASRNGMLGDDEKFYGYKNIEDELALQAATLFSIANGDSEGEQTDKDVWEYLILNGELAGGSYPHPNVEKSGHTVVQKEVFYNPKNFFIGFDIIGKHIVDDATFYLNLDEVLHYYDSAGMTRSETLYRGSLSECLAYPNDFQSKIPAMFGLPVIENNIVEGVVIKPLHERTLPNGKRVIIKNKNAKFSEQAKVKKAVREIPDNVKRLLETGKTYATENRFNNVVSKFVGYDPDDTSQIGKLIPLMVKDTMEDFGKDYGTELKTLEKLDMKSVQKGVTNLCRDIVLKHFN